MKNENELAKKNIEISFEFSRYLLAHPELDEAIPENALILFQIENDRALTKYNKELAKRHKEINQPVIVVKIQGLAPSRLIRPTLATSLSKR